LEQCGRFTTQTQNCKFRSKCLGCRRFRWKGRQAEKTLRRWRRSDCFGQGSPDKTKSFIVMLRGIEFATDPYWPFVS